MNLIEKATRIAVVAHQNQTRKGDGLPYIIHPFMVAMKLIRYGFSEETVAAALVHDVLEDTDFPEKELKKQLGDKVLEIVKTVTNDDTLVWEEKKKKYIETVKNGSIEAKVVATADKIHNLESLLTAYEEQGPTIWQKFNQGKEQKVWFEKEMLKMLKKTWQHPLIDEYKALLEKEMNLIG